MNQDLDRSKAKERYAAGKMRQHSTRALFFVDGFGAASWAPLVPLLRERLAIGEDVLGMLLLCIGIGSLLTMPLSGAAAVRFSCRRTLTLAATFFALLLLALCLVDSMVLAVVSLLVFGAMMGCIDVVANIQAVLVEKAAKRRLMSGMHAMWSVGGFAGAGLFGIWVGTLGLTPFISTCIATGIMLATLSIFSRHLLPLGDVKLLVVILPSLFSVDNVKNLTSLIGTHIDQAYLGSCTGGRTEDFAIAARLLKGRKIHSDLRMVLVPASRFVLKECMEKGYIQTLLEAGATLTAPGCAACLGIHQGLLAEGEACISSTNRNFPGRMGNVKGEIYLGSPASVAAAAIEGAIADPRKYLEGRGEA